MQIQSLSRKHALTPSDAFLKSIETLKRRWQRRHELWILSCYVDLDTVQDLVREVATRVKLTVAYLAFDYSEVYRYGPRELTRAKGALKQSCTKQGIEFECRFLSVTTGLVHGKGYAVFQRVNGKVAGGTLLIGSANLTSPGFKEGKNIELGVLTQQIGHLRSFERIFNKLRGEFGRKVIADEVLQRDRDLFKFALLSTGVFLHKWDGSLRQLVGIRYKIVNEERWAQLPDGLKDEGFELSKTLTRQVLKLDELPKRSLPDGFIKNFTIDTALGRWCPAEIWGEVANPESDAYLEAFKMATTDQILADLVGAATERQKELIHEGFIAPVEDDHLGNWARRIKSLRDTPERLARLHTGWEAFEMPFDAKCKDQIDDLFESLEASLEARNHENWVTRAVRDCIQSKSLVRLDMDEEATCLLRNDRA